MMSARFTVVSLLAATIAAAPACELFEQPADAGDERAEGEGEGEDVGEGEGGGEGEGEGENAGEGEGEPIENPCAPVVTGSLEITEGETLDVVVSCSTGKVVDFEMPLIPPPPAGLGLDDDNHVRWTTDLDDATVVDVAIRDPETRETVVLHIAVADAFGVEGNVGIVDPLTYTEEHGLPVVFLSQQPEREEYVDASLVVDGHRYSIETKLRGASSLGYPKRSFTLKFDRDDRFNLAPRAGQGTASTFVDKKKVVLTTTFDDHAYVRQRLAYQLWNGTSRTRGHRHVEIGSTSVVVYIDGEYFGLYALTDHVDRDLFEESLDLDDGGQLYKAVSHDANFRNTGNPAAGYERRDEPDVDAVEPFSDLATLIRFANETDDDTFRTHLGDYIDVDDVLDWWMFATAIAGEDSYGKNSYLYRPAVELDANGNDVTPVFRIAPWDFNQSFGQSWETSRTGYHMPIDEGWPMQTNLLWERLLSAGYGTTMLSQLLLHDLGVVRVSDLFEAMATETDRAARKDASVWEAAYFDYFGHPDLGDYDSEVALVREWILRRWEYLRVQAPHLE